MDHSLLKVLKIKSRKNFQWIIYTIESIQSDYFDCKTIVSTLI